MKAVTGRNRPPAPIPSQFTGDGPNAWIPHDGVITDDGLAATRVLIAAAHTDHLAEVAERVRAASSGAA